MRRFQTFKIKYTLQGLIIMHLRRRPMLAERAFYRHVRATLDVHPTLRIERIPFLRAVHTLPGLAPFVVPATPAAAQTPGD